MNAELTFFAIGSLLEREFGERPGHTPRLKAFNNLLGTPLGRKPYSAGKKAVFPRERPAGRGSVGAMRRLAPILLLLGSCVPPVRPVGPGPEVITAVEGMYGDLSARRWDALEAHFLPEAALVFATPSGPRRMTPAKFVEMVRKNVEGKEIFEERMTAGSVRAHGDLAVVWSSFEGREGNGDDVRTWSGVDAFTLVKVEGRWRIALIAVSQDPPAPAR
jgi:hypothetical protein